MWQDLQTARVQIESFQGRVETSKVALEGARQKQEVGQRTVLDVLDAQEEVLNAKVNLVRASATSS